MMRLREKRSEVDDLLEKVTNSITRREEEEKEEEKVGAPA